MRKSDFILLIFAVFIWALYTPLNVIRQPLHDLKSPIDSLIPLIPVFIIPYLSYYPFIILTALTLNSKNNFAMRNFLISMIIILLVSYVIYLVFQTYTQRPVITSEDIFSKLLSFWYTIDKPYNAFPSTHTSLSVLSILAWTKSKSNVKGFMILWASLIIFSTLFVKQHYVADVIGGIVLALIVNLVLSKSRFR